MSISARDFLALVEKNRADFEFDLLVRRVGRRGRPGRRPSDHATPHAALAAALGRPPTAKEFARALGVSLTRAYAIAQAKGLTLSRDRGRWTVDSGQWSDPDS